MGEDLDQVPLDRLVTDHRALMNAVLRRTVGRVEAPPRVQAAQFLSSV